MTGRVDPVVGYVIVAHHLPDQLLRLVRALRADGSAPIVVHIDRRRRRAMASAQEWLEQQPGISVLSTRSVFWGHFSIVEATLDAARLLLSRHPEVTHAKHLSGQDYPTRRPSEFCAAIARIGNRSIIDASRLSPEASGTQYDHVRFRYLSRRWRHRLRLPFCRRLPPYPIYKGSAFWLLAREHLEWMLARTDADTAFFRGTLAADEIYFQTMLMESPHAADLVAADLTFTRWIGESPGPEILDSQDLLPLIAATDRFFARKLDPQISADLLDSLDARIAAE